MNPTEYCGRIGQLYNLVSKPELNGAYVKVEFFDSEKGRYGVRTLSLPNSKENTTLVLIKLLNLQFFNYGNTFASEFPGADAMPSLRFQNGRHPPGKILNFSDVQEMKGTGNDENGALVFVESCRALGKKSSSGGPATKVSFRTVVVPNGNDPVVEILNFDFSNGNVSCIQGKNTTFRNCHFGGAAGMQACSQSTEPVRVLFENCLFEEASEGALAVMKTCEVTVLNCTFRNCRIGVHMDGNTNAIVKHCTFIDCHHGVNAPLQHGRSCVLIENCSFLRARRAVRADNGVDIRILGCRFEACLENAVLVHGPKRSVGHIEDTVVVGCQGGISAGSGKVHLTVKNCQITDNYFFGVCCMQNFIGSLTLTNCTYRDNTRTDFMNWSGEKCTVTIDGVVQRSDDREERSKKLEPIFHEMMRVNEGRNECTMGSLKRMRIKKAAGTGHMITCANCETVEPMDVKFKACSKCKNVAYCCRECQVENWKEHKKECGNVKGK